MSDWRQCHPFTVSQVVMCVFPPMPDITGIVVGAHYVVRMRGCDEMGHWIALRDRPERFSIESFHAVAAPEGQPVVV